MKWLTQLFKRHKAKEFFSNADRRSREAALLRAQYEENYIYKYDFISIYDTPDKQIRGCDWVVVFNPYSESIVVDSWYGPIKLDPGFQVSLPNVEKVIEKSTGKLVGYVTRTKEPLKISPSDFDYQSPIGRPLSECLPILHIDK